MAFYFYLARCSDSSLYAGSCTNIQSREIAHNRGKGAKYTAERLPVKIVYFEEFETLILAMRREQQVKRWRRVKKERLAAGNHPTKSEIRFRGYKEEDFEQVWNLHERALREAGAFIVGHGVWDDDLKNIPAVYDNAGGVFVIAETAGMIVGMGALRRVDNETAEIKRMRVLPELQGKGLGTRMLKLLESKAKELGYKKLILDTSLQQQAALHIYTKHGYKEYKRGELGGLTTVWMEKDI